MNIDIWFSISKKYPVANWFNRSEQGRRLYRNIFIYAYKAD